MNVNTPAAPQDLATIIHAGGTSSCSRRRWVIIASVVTLAVVAVIAGITRGAKTLEPQYIIAPVDVVILASASRRRAISNRRTK